MFDNPVLDIAIGLTFIYVLYSLLATTIKEFVATIFAYRGKMLERGIEQMLDGINVKYRWWDRVANFFLWQSQKGEVKRRITGGDDNSKQALTANQANPAPAISKEEKKAAEKETNEKLKAYRDNCFYAKTTVNKPAVNATGSYAAFAAQPAVPGMYLKRRKLNTKGRLFAARVTNHPLYKRASDNSWFSNGPAYLKADVFSDILLDLLKPEGNTTLLLKDIANAISDKAADPTHPLNPELKKILYIYIEQANGDLQRFKLLIENWYDQTMDRVSGWYKRQASKILIIIGLVLAIIFKVSTIDIIKRLSTDKPTRDALVNNAQEYVSKNMQNFGQPKTPVDTAKKTIDTTKHAVDTTKKDTGTVKPAADTLDAIADAKLKLKRIDSLYQGIAPNNNLLGLGWDDYGAAKDSIQFIKDSIAYRSSLKYKDDSAKYSDALSEYRKDSATYVKDEKGKMPRKPTPPGPGKPGKPGIFGKVWYVISETVTTPRFLLGFLITAFAISLGAPFWFDLLNKFINLRVSGTKPEDSATAGASKTANLNKKPDPTAKG